MCLRVYKVRKSILSGQTLISGKTAAEVDFSECWLWLRSNGTGRIFDRWKIRASGRFVLMEPCQMYENLNAEAFKNLNTKIEDEFIAGAVNNFTATLWTP